MKLLSILGFCLLILSSCSTKKKEAELIEMTRPDWLKDRPVSSMYFYGIGITPKQGGEIYYTERAKDKALADIAKQINTKIKSEQSFYKMEDNKGVHEYIQSRVRATSNEFLEAYEYVDKWEDLTNYYTFYRLSKNEFYARKAKRKEDALKLSWQKLQQAQKAEQHYDYKQALEQYAAAIDAISGYLNEQTALNNTDLFEVSRAGLTNIVTAMELVFEPKEITANTQQTIAEGKASVLIYCHKEVARNIPVHFNYSGGFLSKDKYQSAIDGRVKLPEFTLANKTETMKVAIDLKALGRQITKNLIVRQIVEKQKPATATLPIKVI